MKTIGQPVLCSQCGKTLSGTLCMQHGWYVHPHRKPDGSYCWGYRYSDHRPIAPRSEP